VCSDDRMLLLRDTCIVHVHVNGYAHANSGGLSLEACECRGASSIRKLQRGAQAWAPVGTGTGSGTGAWRMAAAARACLFVPVDRCCVLGGIGLKRCMQGL
jgi:hypothetical protein